MKLGEVARCVNQGPISDESKQSSKVQRVTGSEVGRRCISSEAGIGVERRVSGARGGQRPGLTTAQEGGGYGSLMASWFTVSTKGVLKGAISSESVICISQAITHYNSFLSWLSSGPFGQPW